ERQAAAVLPTAQQVAARQLWEGAGVAGDAGDDDEDSECDAAFPGEDGAGLADEDEFYADAWETR
ncbi:MAG TPA: hypothetical protein VGJ54_15245, partial [Streptosporangiaceae bacterium]